MSNESWISHAYPLKQLMIRLQGTRHSDKAAIISQTVSYRAIAKLL
jgi:hypothetical protein